MILPRHECVTTCRLNEEAVVKTELKDVLFSVRKLGESDASYFESKFTTEELAQVQIVRDLEKRKGILPWYPLTRFMLARIVYNVSTSLASEINYITIFVCAKLQDD